MSPSAIYQRLKATDSLPSPQGIALEVLRIAEDDTVSVREIAQLVEKDPAISARLIRAANAPIHGLRHRVTTVRDAATSLGIGAVQSVTLAFSLLSENREGNCEAFNYERFWSTSLASASAMRRLASKTDTIAADEAFTYGLLRRIGRLGLVSVEPARYTEVLAAATDDQHLAEVEREVFEIDADELSALMMFDWGMPRYREVRDGTSTDSDFAALIQIAESFAVLLLDPVGTPQRMEAIYDGMQAAGLDGATVAKTFELVAEDWRQAGTEMDVPTHPVPTFREIFEMARTRSA